MHLNDFTTDRLTADHWGGELGDPETRAVLAHDLATLLTPAVLGPLPDPLQLTGQTIDDWVTARAGESDVLALRLRSSGALVGLLILATQDGAPPNCHIGYLFAQDVWGQGYASELIAALVAQAALHAPLTLIGGVSADNPASARVLQKAGFTPAPQAQPDDMTLFQLDLP